MFRPWDYEPKSRPSSEDIDRLLRVLLSSWSEGVGEELGRGDRPLAFLGAKGPRLLVTPIFALWGTWSHLSSIESERRACTRFRAAINRAIAPHEIDHVDFTTDSKSF